MSASRLRLEDLAALPRWPAAQVLALTGNCRGSLMQHWALHCTRRWGPGAVPLIRQDLGVAGSGLPDAPTLGEWVPAALQVRLVDIVLDRFLGDDWRTARELFHADVERSGGRLLRAAVKAVGPSPFFHHAGKIHPHLYDVGVAAGAVDGKHATVTCSGAGLFLNPTWQALQLLGFEVLLALASRRPLDLYGETLPPDGFQVTVEWA
ncbi:MAG: hypothetical protein HYV63_12265 [Candidatus Schekmanbacteria bacterium]|nr:hypothetical protein [Candidatus Schekmanbacteria bacterium]